MERRDVALKFGDAFAAALDSVPVGTWSGPLESGYGLHLVLIRERVPGAVPPLEEVRSVVLREVQHQRQLKGLEQLYRQMRAKYDVSIQWPEAAGK
jgi:parvulin-like peptidyl-prolyl isomerase